MKRILAMILLGFMLSLCACDTAGVGTPAGDDTTAVQPSDAEDTTATPPEETETDETADDSSVEDTTYEDTTREEETTVPPDDASEDDAYKQMAAQRVTSYAHRCFTFSETGWVIALWLPSEWEITRTAQDSCAIVRQGQEIGTLVKGGKQGSSDWKLLDTDIVQGGDVLSEHYLEKQGVGETLRFRHRYYFRFTEGITRRIITLTVEYSALDSEAAQAVLAGSIMLARGMVNAGFGTLTEAQWGSVAILGNSFISSSAIGGILHDMHVQNNRECYIDAYSRGYAHVDTYVNDSHLMAQIRGGRYNAVFICGVDSNVYLGTLKAACDASGTKLVIFPAHNEPRDKIDSAVKSYPEIQLMDWKAEIDALIADGRDYWDFCENDDHKHSTELAGYVGAHMIYRAIWDEVPMGESGYGMLQNEVDRVLGEYAATGRVLDITEDDVLLLT